MKIYKLLLALVALPMVGCSASFFAASNSAQNDLYTSHDRTEIAERRRAEAEARKAEAEARKAELEARIAEIAAYGTSRDYDAQPSYTSVLADDYESAYARRLKGLDSPTYNMPSSYLDARYSTEFHYVSAYDPAFYNVIVMGDQVWVEPKYVTAMFGSWGRPYYYNPWYYGWGSSYRYGYAGWSLSWYDPWYYDPWFGPSWYYAGYYNPWYSPWYGPAYYPYPHHPGHYPGWNGGTGRVPGQHIVHRPSGGSNVRPYGGSSINRTTNGNRNWSSGVYQGGQNGRGNSTVGRTPSGSRTNDRNTDRSNYQDSNRSERRSPNSGNNNSSWGGNNNSSRGSYGGGSYGGGSYGGGGGNRGGFSGSSSRGR